MLKKARNFFSSPIFIGILLVVSLVLRRLSLPAISLDMEAGLFNWYGFILKKGFSDAFKENFALYTPPYLYLLWLASLFDGIFSRVTLIKLISVIFDLVSSFFILKIVWLKYPRSSIPWLAAAIGFTLPTVILNSTYWGQCDSIYTSFLLGCLFFILTDRPLWGVAFFAVAFAFKLQAVFLAPFLVLYTLRNKIPWFSAFLVPIIYGVISLPAIIVGRDWWDVLTIYLHQTDKFPKWSSTTPTMYLLLQGKLDLTPTLNLVTVGLAGSIILIWIWLAWRKKEKDNHNSISLAGLASVALVPFILPRMHQRYFYPQDVFSLVVAFFFPELWFLPILSQIISVIAYGPFLFNTSFKISLLGRNLDALLYLALPLEVLILGVILWRQFQKKPRTDNSAVN